MASLMKLGESPVHFVFDHCEATILVETTTLVIASQSMKLTLALGTFDGRQCAGEKFLHSAGLQSIRLLDAAVIERLAAAVGSVPPALPRFQLEISTRGRSVLHTVRLESLNGQLLVLVVDKRLAA